jgi:hypothetical protein
MENAAKSKACRVQTCQAVGKEVCRESRGKQTLLRRLADRSLLMSKLHSAAVLELSANVVQRHDVLAELEVV